MTTPGAAFTRLLAESYVKLVGEPLIPEGMSGDEAAAWQYDTPFGQLAQNMSADPTFVYANRTAQEHFGYKSGRRFWIEDTTVWNLLGSGSELVGQAALIRNWAADRNNRPDRCRCMIDEGKDGSAAMASNWPGGPRR